LNQMLEEVANRASVSPLTVSRVINDHPSVRLKTRKRAIEDGGYRPHAVFRGLTTNTTRILAIITLKAKSTRSENCHGGDVVT